MVAGGWDEVLRSIQEVGLLRFGARLEEREKEKSRLSSLMDGRHWQKDGEYSSGHRENETIMILAENILTKVCFLPMPAVLPNTKGYFKTTALMVKRKEAIRSVHSAA